MKIVIKVGEFKKVIKLNFNRTLQQKERPESD